MLCRFISATVLRSGRESRFLQSTTHTTVTPCFRGANAATIRIGTKVWIGGGALFFAGMTITDSCIARGGSSCNTECGCWAACCGQPCSPACARSERFWHMRVFQFRRNVLPAWPLTWRAQHLFDSHSAEQLNLKESLYGHRSFATTATTYICRRSVLGSELCAAGCLTPGRLSCPER